MFATNLLLVFFIPYIQLSTDKNIDIDCDQYDNDRTIIRAFPYHIDINSTLPNSAKKTYARVDQHDHVIFLQIINKDSIPPDLSCFKHLVELKIISTTSFDIRSFPTSLTNLSISEVKMPSLSSDINRLINLEKLEITKTDLREISELTTGLSKLKVLKLNWNDLQELPSSMIKLKNLIELEASNNPALSSLYAVNNHPKLEILLASSCSIKEMPKGLLKLQHLRLTNNKLYSVKNIETLGRATSKKKTFLLNNNQIEKIPIEVCSILTPYEINLDYNRIDTIPIYICESKTLTYLSIRGNLITEAQWRYSLRPLRACLPNLTISYNNSKLPFSK